MILTLSALAALAGPAHAAPEPSEAAIRLLVNTPEGVIGVTVHDGLVVVDDGNGHVTLTLRPPPGTTVELGSRTALVASPVAASVVAPHADPLDEPALGPPVPLGAPRAVIEGPPPGDELALEPVAPAPVMPSLAMPLVFEEPVAEAPVVLTPVVEAPVAPEPDDDAVAAVTTDPADPDDAAFGQVEFVHRGTRACVVVVDGEVAARLAEGQRSAALYLAQGAYTVEFYDGSESELWHRGTLTVAPGTLTRVGFGRTTPPQSFNRPEAWLGAGQAL